ncbi:Hypothetical predicted protein, partial [Mytilus galloprovincialis]
KDFNFYKSKFSIFVHIFNRLNAGMHGWYNDRNKILNYNVHCCFSCNNNVNLNSGLAPRGLFGIINITTNDINMVKEFLPEIIINEHYIKWQLRVNVMALCLCIRESVKMMRANGVDDGHIININSLSGHRCGKAHFYSATKHAVTALTEGIRWELREINSHIKITSISPGLVKTNFAYTAVGEVAADECYSTRQSLDPQDIANAIETVLSYPSHVQVSEMMIRPTEQVV